MLYKSDARKLWKVFHFVCFHFPLFRHFFCLLLHFFSTIEIETKFFKKYPAEFRNYVRCQQRKSACKVNKHFEMLSSLLDATSFGEDESEIIDAVTPKTVKFRRRCTFFPCTRYTREISTKICWIIERMKNLLSFPIQPPNKMMMAPRKLIQRYVQWIRNPAEQEKLANRNK